MKTWVLEKLLTPLTSNDNLLWFAKEANQLYSYDVQAKTLEPGFTFDSPIQLLEYLPGIGLIVGLDSKLILLDQDGLQREISVG